MTYNPERNLWQEVLLRQIDDALLGPTGISGKQNRLNTVETARAYLSTPSTNLSHLCALADIDMDVLISRMTRLIADAPEPEDLVTNKKAFTSNLTKRAAKPKAKRVRFTDRMITINGKAMTLGEWSKHTGVAANRISSRINQGWSAERAVTQPVGQRVRT